MNHFGISGVGKTSLVRRYTEDKWNPAGTASTTGAFFVTHKTDFKGTRVKLQIWDTAGTCFVLASRLALWRCCVGRSSGLGRISAASMAWLVLGYLRPARLLAHRLSLTPSGSLPDPGWSNPFEYVAQIGVSTLHSSNSIAEHATSVRLKWASQLYLCKLQ
jgi:hypothetical protein